MNQYASVYILDLPYSVDRAFEYFIPPYLRDKIRVGGFVTVPFGGGNRRTIALVFALSDKSSFDNKKIKPVASVCTDELYLPEKLLGLAFYMKEHTLCTVGEAVHAMIPAAAFSQLKEYYSPTDKEGYPSPSDNKICAVLDFIREKKAVSEGSLKSAFGMTGIKNAVNLSYLGFVTRYMIPREGVEPLTKSSYSLKITSDELECVLRGEKGYPRVTAAGQLAVLRVMREKDLVISRDELSKMGVSKANIDALIKKELIEEHKTVFYRDPYSGIEGSSNDTAPLRLSEEQRNAYEVLCEMADKGEPCAALLHGVTGSGKTSVMMALIDRMLSSGKGVILLLPEISLTPQTINIFKARYGDVCTVVHSALSSGERYDSYLRISEGSARVVIGTRSAVFSPVHNLGLIIIDEEQEQTYKSDSSPKYHARDIARYRCASEGAMMLLASATPSIESYMKAKEGKYKLIKLKNRYGGAKLPEVEIVDMREESAVGNVSPIGSRLASELLRTKANDEQSILFLNRRGYNTFVSCRKCGEALMCPSCSVSMTYHTKSGGYDDGYLSCHFCGHRAALPSKCPKCGSDKLMRMGFGTQRVEQELGTLMPEARILRMDTDTTSAKFSYDRLLGTFRKGEADLLIGTQMVTKGHDFPRVTLVGVLLADASLYVDDFRASERTFSMLTQVIGRAGRATENGKAVIQTNNPENDVINLAAKQDYETFFEREIKLRRHLVFPPFCDIVMMTVSSEDERELFVAMNKLHGIFTEMTGEGGEFSDVKTIAFGPFEAPVYKVEGKCRMRMIIKCRLNKRTRCLFASILQIFTSERAQGKSRLVKKPTVSIDFNPSGF